jgi:hypothetical protein
MSRHSVHYNNFQLQVRSEPFPRFRILALLLLRVQARIVNFQRSLEVSQDGSGVTGQIAEVNFLEWMVKSRQTGR